MATELVMLRYNHRQPFVVAAVRVDGGGPIEVHLDKERFKKADAALLDRTTLLSVVADALRDKKGGARLLAKATFSAQDLADLKAGNDLLPADSRDIVP